jgi:ligand-binding SRPBCC domain-containing protein
MTRAVRRSVLIHRPAADVFAFHADPANVARVLPAGILRLSGARTLAPRAVLRVALGIPPLVGHGALIVLEWDPPRSFLDAQKRGPFALWEHRHRFLGDGTRTRLVDEVTFALPGPLGAFEPLTAAIIAAALAGKLARTKRALER